MGNIQLSLYTLNKYQAELKAWFSPSPQVPQFSILLYGCNVAAGDAGEEFINKLHNITGAENAALTTPIGNADFAGNWELNIITNNVSSQLAINESVQQAYTGILSTISGTVFTDYDNDGTQETGNDAVESGEEFGCYFKTWKTLEK